MLGVATYDEDDPADDSCASTREEIGVGEHLRQDARRRVPRRAAARPSPDPFFGGDGPDRTGCLRCGRCMVGCPHGAKNTLVKNYLWFAERAGVEVMPERDGGRHPAARRARRLRRLRGHHRALGRVAAARPPDADRAAAWWSPPARSAPTGCSPACRLNGSLPRDLRPPRRAACARTPRRSSPSRCPRARPTCQQPRRDHRLDLPRPRHAHRDRRLRRRGRQRCARLFTLLVGDGTPLTRPLKLAGAAVAPPGPARADAQPARLVAAHDHRARHAVARQRDRAAGAHGPQRARPAAAPSRTRSARTRPSSRSPTSSRSGSPSAPAASRRARSWRPSANIPTHRAHPRRRGDRRRRRRPASSTPASACSATRTCSSATARRSRPTSASTRASRSPRWPSTR